MVPEFVLDMVARQAVDFLIMTEDLPDPESRVGSTATRSSWSGAAPT